MLLIGRVVTQTEQGEVEAVYVDGGQIGDVGSQSELSARYPRAQKLRIERITPGLHDAHTHPQMWGEALGMVDLSGISDPRQAADRVAQRAAETPAGQWIRGAGYLFADYPHKDLLDAATPDHPVFLQSRDFHSGWANSKALELARIARDTPDPSDGSIVRDGAGEATGYLLERAQDYLHEALPKSGIAELERGLKDLAQRGFTATHHMGWSPLSEAEELAKANRLPVRLWWAMDKHNWRGTTPGWRGDSLHVAAVKFFMDGALGSRTAWTLRPYPDGSLGMALDDLELIRAEGRAALEAGFTLVTHAIGSRAVHEWLNLVEWFEQNARHTRRPDPELKDLTYRMEHAQHIADADLQRLKNLPVTLSMQPTHALEDAGLVRHHLPGQEHEAFRLRELWETGLPMAFGSDAPVAKPVWEDNLEASLRHPLNPAQSLTEAEVLWAHTRGAALAAGWLHHGLIRPETPADLTLWENGKVIGRVFGGVLELK